MSDLDRAAAALEAADKVVAITGAGISAESGVPTFRGSGGLWRRYRAEDLATPEAFERNPLLVWEWYWWRRTVIADAKPNPGHLALASFERRLPAFLLLTQNVDGLHAEAGSRQVIELHGNIWRARCTAECDRRVDQRHDPSADVTKLPRCSCGALLRPDVVWFGEGLDSRALDRATLAVQSCAVLLVIGTSAIVYPVAALPAMAKRHGAAVVEVNVAETPLTSHADIVLRGPSGVVLPELERRL